MHPNVYISQIRQISQHPALHSLTTFRQKKQTVFDSNKYTTHVKTKRKALLFVEGVDKLMEQ